MMRLLWNITDSAWTQQGVAAALPTTDSDPDAEDGEVGGEGQVAADPLADFCAQHIVQGDVRTDFFTVKHASVAWQAYRQRVLDATNRSIPPMLEAGLKAGISAFLGTMCYNQKRVRGVRNAQRSVFLGYKLV
ncbi:hypothetical protein WJX72_010409 [[Myrmecia] bisecta]|uniref:Uncharacterized protein n=1 Tax=[Myrmecia] bisecta TaxID=41462 RepID=A0AAW1Q2J0_9CHLO